METYPPETVDCLMNIIGTHDTERILTVLGSSIIPYSKEEMSVSRLSEEELKQGIKLLKIAVLLQMTLPGIPCIYYGDEAGLQGWKDPFNRRCYPWGNENRDILDYYMSITSFRRKVKVLASGKYKCLIHDKSVFVFQRFNDKEKIIIAVNLSNSEITLKLRETMTEYGKNKESNIFSLEKENYLILAEP